MPKDPHPRDLLAIPSDRHDTLAERREARIRERRLLREKREYPPGERKDRHRAIVYLSTLPTDQLIAVHKAAVQMFTKP